MGLSDFFARFYKKVFIGVYGRQDVLQIGVVVLGSGGEVEQQRHAFAGGLNEEVLTFLQEQVSSSPYNYIAVVTDSGACGALPTCSLSKAKELAPAVGGSRTVCIEEEWMNYCDEEVAYSVVERYAALSPDALYSPFALMHAFFEAQMAGAHALYLLLTPEAVSLAVVKERHLRFAELFRGEEGLFVPALLEKIVIALETYYGKPCCRGEFIESVRIADGAGVGNLLAKALEETLLVETELHEADTALLCAQTCMKEYGYAL
jgi:hypothetical protein